MKTFGTFITEVQQPKLADLAPITTQQVVSVLKKAGQSSNKLMRFQSTVTGGVSDNKNGKAHRDGFKASRLNQYVVIVAAEGTMGSDTQGWERRMRELVPIYRDIMTAAGYTVVDSPSWDRFFVCKTKSLNEKYLKGFDSSMAPWVEVYEDPTLSELTSIAKLKPGAAPHYYLGAFMTKGHLIVWDRDKCEHSEMKWAIPDGSERDVPNPDSYRGKVPLYLYYWPENKTCGLSFASWSWEGRVLSMDAVVKQAKAHRSFKIFKTIIDADE